MVFQLTKSLIQFSVDGWSCVPSLLFTWGRNYGGGNEDNGDLLQKVPCLHCCAQCPSPAAGHRRPTPPLEMPGHPQASLGQSPVGSLLLSPGSWCSLGIVCALQEWSVCFLQFHGSPAAESHWSSKSDSLGIPSPFAGSQGCCEAQTFMIAGGLLWYIVL